MYFKFLNMTGNTDNTSDNNNNDNYIECYS